MTRKSIALWTLAWTLTALLLVAWVALADAGPRKAPAAPGAAPGEPPVLLPELSPSEQYCRVLGIFGYRRAAERDAGRTFTDVISATRQWETDNDIHPTIRGWHERIVTAIFTLEAMTPAATRKIVEHACLESERTRTDHPATQPKGTPGTPGTPDARLRY